MPYDNPDPTDPMTLCGIGVDTDDDRAVREMADCFVEEYVRMGFDPQRILRMFRSEAYAGPFLAFRSLGENEILLLIDSHMRRRGPSD